MQHALSRGGREILARLAEKRVLLGFDFDGTLAPIVSTPMGARMRPGTRALLRRTMERYPVCIISGRARADVGRRVPAGASVFGNHGMEPSPGLARYRALARRWRRILEARLAGVAGILIEDKTYSLAVHFRAARDKAAARSAIEAAARDLGPLRWVGGNQVVNLIPAGAPHKGTALIAERKRRRCAAALFVGDDDTDEDVFALDDRSVLGIRVGRRRASAASLYLRDQDEIDLLLELLLALRPVGPSRAAASSSPRGRRASGSAAAAPPAPPRPGLRRR